MYYSDIDHKARHDQERYKSKFMGHIQEEKHQKEIAKQKKILEAKAAKEKAHNYARLVKEMHWPKVSQTKKAEMDTIRASLMTKYSRADSLASAKHKSGHKSFEKSGSPTGYLGFRGRLPRRDDSHNISASQISRLGSITDQDQPYSTRARNKINWKKMENPMVPKKEEKIKPEVKDYLRERRQKREHSRGSVDSYGYRKKRQNVTIDEGQRHRSLAHPRIEKPNNADLNESRETEARVRDIRNKAKQIENAAERKEQMMKVRGDTVEDASEVNDMLIDAIEAKLAILGEI